MGIEGQINISLQAPTGRVEKVLVESSRPVHAARIFHGKAVTDVLKTLPMLFSICGTAQACAAIRASEQALRITPPKGLEDIREALVRMETLREQLWRILLDWPQFLNMDMQQKPMAQIQSLQREHRQLLTGGLQPFYLQSDGAAIQSQKVADLSFQVKELLQHSVFGMPVEEWLLIESENDLCSWAKSVDTVAAGMVRYILDQGWQKQGRCEVEALPELNAEQLHSMFEDPDFVMHPLLEGECKETTSCSRTDSTLLQQLRNIYINGLLVRTVARLTEIARLADQLDSLPFDGAELENTSAENQGIGQIAAARGQLIHRITLDGERVGRYQILAPTEWNFHPQGLIARSLATLKDDDGDIEQQARLLINAIDPCVGYELTVN